MSRPNANGLDDADEARTQRENDPFQGLPPVGTYWTSGNLPTALGLIHQEAYATCARCGSFVNAEDRHDDWHRAIEHALLHGGA